MTLTAINIVLYYCQKYVDYESTNELNNFLYEQNKPELEKVIS